MTQVENPQTGEGCSDPINAIRGAMAFGYQNTNQPPEGHWLAEFWQIGRKERQAEVELSRLKSIDFWTLWSMDTEGHRNLTPLEILFGGQANGATVTLTDAESSLLKRPMKERLAILRSSIEQPEMAGEMEQRQRMWGAA